MMHRLTLPHLTQHARRMAELERHVELLEQKRRQLDARLAQFRDDLPESPGTRRPTP